ncbi:signal peptidase II [Emcibacteraceae bacterium]|jgi:signal peptidase II|uniref:signal peptidase II n=1 Tax=Pseudemcibacter sp. TaxID=2943293 RepID=UPI0023138858|nr:signal peptidase II [Kordiimonadaceae bacterium]MDA9180326.1 signal peptidase II [Emcibacteraceae bacterium]MDA9553850.1 signal peptidase II [Emcibacteraceae bacterium]MDA9771484.1 signal peptidase II [Emcibacteraceae bacterium]MDC1090609.1 signal peptidase II [Emcibacteraceae bacterium]
MIRIGAISALIAFLLDRVSKWWFIDVYELPLKGTVEILPIFDVVMVWNRGVSFGFLSANDDLGRWTLVAMNLVIVAVLLYWLKSAKNIMLSSAIGLVIGGAFGNIYDRIKFGAVADFFQFHWQEWYFAVFNVADSFIFIGAMLLIFNSTFGNDADDDKEKE